MIAMIFIGIILNYLGLLHGWCLFWYIFSFIIITLCTGIKININR